MQKMMYLLVSQHVSGIIMPIIRRMVQNLYKILHLVGYLFTFMIQDARSHEIKIFLHGLVADLKSGYTWVYGFIYNYLKNNFWLNVNAETCSRLLITIHVLYCICAFCWYISDIIT
jgi:hypothetical protein